MLTDFYNIWQTVSRVNVPHNHYSFAHLTYVAYCCYTTVGNIGYSSKGLTRQSHTWMHKKLMPYLCCDARASFSLILALRMVAVIIVTSYWCSRCCHPFVPLLVALMYSNKTVHQHILRIRPSSSFSMKLPNSLLPTYGLQIVRY